MLQYFPDSRSVLLTCVLIVGSLAVSTVAVAGDARPMNDEEGWLLSGDGSSVYAVRQDPLVTRNGRPTTLLAPVADTHGEYGTWMRVINAEPFRGKRVRIVGFTRAEGATERADFWARVQGAQSPRDGQGIGGGGWFDIATDANWERHEFVFVVSDKAVSIQYGIGLAGPGRAWCDDVTLEVLGDQSPATTQK